MSKTYSAGIVTAYGAAKRAGYQGTYEDFCRQQAGYAENAAAVEQAKTTAANAAITATAKAGEATTAATDAQNAKIQTEQAASQALTDIGTARSGAISAVQTEGQTQTANARAQAQAAAQSATTASAKASEASASATSAGLSATNAATSATSAAQSASAAQSVLESIPEEYSDLSEDVDKLKADLSENVGDLKSAFDTLDVTVTSITSRSVTATGNLIAISDQFGDKAEIIAQDVEVLHTGKNILAYPYANTSPSSTQNGITWVQNSEGIITGNGTATANSQFNIVNQTLSKRRSIKAGTYTFSGCPSGGSNSTYKMIIGITDIGESADYGDGVTITIPTDTTFYMYFRIHNGQTVTNLEINPQIEVGTLKTSREKYVSNSYTVNGTERITLYAGVNTFSANNSITVKYSVEKNELISDVKEYGAIGDGVTDDTAALQTAINDCENRTLSLSEGTYLFSSTLHINGQITIKGCGKNSILKLADTFSLDPIDWRPDHTTSKSKFKYPFICIDADNCVLDNFTLEGQTSVYKDENEDGITVQGENHILSNLIVHSINYFKDLFTSRKCLCPAWGINIFNASNVLVTNCHVYDCGYENIGTENSDSVVITESKFGDACQTSTQIHRKSKHIKFTYNYVYQTENVRRPECPAFTMDANPNADEEMDDILVLGNTLLSVVNTVAGGENNVRIQDNYIKGPMVSNQHEIYPNGLLITGNKLDERINMCADNTFVQGNIINCNSQFYMIRIYGNNSAESGNHGIGTITATTIVTHD